MLPEIGRVKNFLSLTRPHSRMCIRIYNFTFKKQTKKQGLKKGKKTKEEKRIYPENRFKKINLRPPGRKSFCHPDFRKQKEFFLALLKTYSFHRILILIYYLH